MSNDSTIAKTSATSKPVREQTRQLTEDELNSVTGGGRPEAPTVVLHDSKPNILNDAFAAAGR